MKPCHKLEPYLSGRLAGAARKDFERHIEQCAGCREKSVAWSDMAHQLQRWGEARRLGPPETDHRRRLLAAALEASRPGGRRQQLALAVAGLSLMAVGLALWLGWSPSMAELGDKTGTSAPAAQLRVLHSHHGRVERQGNAPRVILETEAGGSLLVALGNDQLSLDQSTRLVWRGSLGKNPFVTLRLHQGSISVRAALRREPTQLAVASGSYRVVVIGTRFAVTRLRPSGVKVEVDHGVVELRTPGDGRHRIEAGMAVRATPDSGVQRLSLTRRRRAQIKQALRVDRPQASLDPSQSASRSALSSPLLAQPSEPRPVQHPAPGQSGPAGSVSAPAWDPVQVAKWLGASHLQRAEATLRQRLRQAPRDARAWKLLARCLRMGRKWAQAVRALRKVMQLGGRAAALHATYQAAMILQDRLAQPALAARMLADFLRRAPRGAPLRSHAKLRLATVLLARGRKAEAIRHLQEIVRSHRGTTAALQAQRLLGQLRQPAIAPRKARTP